MILLQKEELLAHADSIIHDETQLHRSTLDLTVGSIERLTAAGSLDFGGSEFKRAEGELREPVKRNPDDSYGWWSLEQGSYRVHFNESFKSNDDLIYLITAHSHLSRAGVQMNSQVLEGGNLPEKCTADLYVGELGINIKENARIATVTVLGA